MRLTISEHYQLQQLADKYSGGDISQLGRNIVAMVKKEEAMLKMSGMHREGETCDKQ